MRTENLRRQHDSALRIAGEITTEANKLAAEPCRRHAVIVTLQLAKLTGLLKIHFAQEDRSLYPSLMASSRSGVAEVARNFVEEMGQIGPLYEAFAAKWSNADRLVTEPGLFKSECASIFGALAGRIERETNELYPLADTEHQLHAA